MIKKKKRGVAEDLITGGMGISLGATAVSSLPASSAQAGVLGGMGVMGGFFKPIATIGAAGIVIKQLKKFPKRDKKIKSWRNKGI